MMAISSGGLPARPATAIAGGASNALAGVAPAPIVATTKPIAKNMIGSTPAWPRHRRTARAVSRASVPFDSAMLKSSVTPTSVTNSATGNPASTASGDIPPRNTPTRSARASDNTPTLIVVVQLRTTASARAATETQARFIACALRRNRRQVAHELGDIGEVLDRFHHLEGLGDGGRRQHQCGALGEFLVELVARERPIRAAAVPLVGVLDQAPAVRQVHFDRAADLLEAARLDFGIENPLDLAPSSPAPARCARTRR